MGFTNYSSIFLTHTKNAYPKIGQNVVFFNLLVQFFANSYYTLQK